MSDDLTKAFDDFEGEFRRQKAQQKRPSILVAGYTGSGKTSIISAVCGTGIVPDAAIGAGLPKTQGFDCYENDLIRFYDSKGLEPGATAERDFTNAVDVHVRKLQGDPNVDNHVHLVWYAIQGPGARVTPCDLRLMNDIFPKNQLVLITKNDITRPQQREAMTEVLRSNAVPLERIIPCADTDNASLRRLVDRSYDLLPEAYRAAFVSAQVLDLERKKSNAKKIIHTAALSASGVAATPLPFSDAILITPIQIGMIAGLAIVYGEPATTLKSAFLPVIAQAMGILTAASLSKLFPGLGSLIAAGVAFALTAAVGEVVHRHLVARFDARMNDRPEPDFVFDPQFFLRIFDEFKNKK